MHSWVQRLAPSERRLIRFSVPKPQLQLALGLLALTVGFAILLVANGYAAFGRILPVLFEVAPTAVVADLEAQSGFFLVTTVSLLLGYALAVVGICAGFVHHLLGPVVALERQARALKFGDYDVRVSLRDGESVHGDLARYLNDLADTLQREQRDLSRQVLDDSDVPSRDVPTRR